MKISRNWLQTYFTETLPQAEELERALTFHAFEIDGIDVVGADSILDVKVTPNRGHDCLCHHGIARELSAILKLQLSLNALAAGTLPSGMVHLVTEGSVPAAPLVTVSIDTPLCRRYVAGYMKGVKVGPSPQWLQERLASLGQRSINNVVDATNYVMFDLGQPLHAFDAAKLQSEDGHALSVRAARMGEKLIALDEKEYTLNETMLVITDAHADVPIGIAGVKGGMPAGIDEATTDIILESANFDGVSVRKTAQALKLRTDASMRFEQQISPELASEGMQAVVQLIQQIAGGELVGYTDVYPQKQQQKSVGVTVEKINRVLGVSLTGADVADALQRLQLPYREIDSVFEVFVPPLRLDLEIPEDLIEEVGRIVGYDRVPSLPLPAWNTPIEINKNFYKAEKIRECLVSQGFSEVFTSVFADKGDRVVLNKVDGVKPYLRTEIQSELYAALEKNIRNKDILGLKQVKLFEIGSVWKDGREQIVYELAVEKLKKEKTTEDYKQELEIMLAGMPDNPERYDQLPTSATQRYQTFSRYPYIVRDVAFWTPQDTNESDLVEMIQKEAGELCIKISRFDRFEKNDKVSLAYRLIFQSFERTLTDEEVNPRMEKVYTKLKDVGFEIR